MSSLRDEYYRMMVAQLDMKEARGSLMIIIVFFASFVGLFCLMLYYIYKGVMFVTDKIISIQNEKKLRNDAVENKSNDR